MVTLQNHYATLYLVLSCEVGGLEIVMPEVSQPDPAHEFVKDSVVLAMPPANEQKIREALMRRLDFAHDRGKAHHDSLIALDQSGVLAIVDRAQGNVGFALYALYHALPTAPELLSGVPPFVIDGERIASLNLTDEGFKFWHEYGRNMCVINMDAPREGRNLPPEVAKLLPKAREIVESFQHVVGWQLR